jgi:hypothetical protein
MAEVIWNMATDYSLDETGDATDITADAIADAVTFFANIANKDTTLILYYPPGTYHFYNEPSTSETAGIRIVNFTPGGTSDAGRLVFKGSGPATTKFIFYNNQSHDGTDSTSSWGILFRNCRRIHVRDVHITVSQQTVSQGTVRAIGTGYIDLQVPAGFATPEELELDPTNSAGKALRLYSYAVDGRNPRIVFTDNGEHDTLIWTTSADQGGGIWRLTLSPGTTVANYPIGGIVGIKGKAGKDIGRTVDCFNIEVHNIRMSRKTRWNFVNSLDTVVTTVRVVREVINGIVACLASPDGGPQFQSQVGGVSTGTPTTGLIIANCNITGTGDDCIGLFEQSGLCFGNTCRDSFARGIYNSDPGTGLAEAEIAAQNTLIRSTLLTASYAGD